VITERPMPGDPTPLATLLAEHIRAWGPISFAKYMDACLYDPQHGYYTRAEQLPRRDYFTSVDASPIFGRLLTRQFQEIWVQLEKPAEFLLVELGAGSGALAAQILDFSAESFPEFYSALQFVAVERSAVRRAAATAGPLAKHAAAARFAAVSDLPAQIACGCIFSNEFFDALPVHRLVREGNDLREIYVGLGANGLCEQFGALSAPALAEYLTEQGITLQEGQIAEISLEACAWIKEVGARLARGFVLTVDYGHQAEELYDYRHMRGTLLAYEKHRASENFFRGFGEPREPGRTPAHRLHVAVQFPAEPRAPQRFRRPAIPHHDGKPANSCPPALENADLSRRHGRDIPNSNSAKRRRSPTPVRPRSPVMNPAPF
jgi:SAM-dependent MidA family methyltransferase